MNLLSIGGSDPSGGAGIQSDIKTFNELNAHGLTVITAVTAQNTSKFVSAVPVSQKILREQIRSVFTDFEIDGVKISMVYNSDTIKMICEELKDKKMPIVVDPVIRSTTGGTLLEKSAVRDFKKYIVPLAAVITPNKFEAETITETKIDSEESLREAAKKIQKLGAKNVVITGIEKGGKIADYVLEGDRQYLVSGAKISGTNHGSGCNYSAAMIYSLARHKSVKKSIEFSKKYSHESIKHAKKVGSGIAITQNKNQDNTSTRLSQAISEFTELKNIYTYIPECQTNFVFSKKNPRSIKDILGISGRIVRAGTRVIVAGSLEYGGSKHVATALVSMSQKFPEIRSAINLKYTPEIIARLRKERFRIREYDRRAEPERIKNEEGQSVGWGIKSAIRNSRVPPDAVYHRGDFGKEAMIIIFGSTPSKVMEKISRIIQTSQSP